MMIKENILELFRKGIELLYPSYTGLLNIFENFLTQPATDTYNIAADLLLKHF